jgi:ribosomal protein S18 acetylase RimI-like enzyme
VTSPDLTVPPTAGLGHTLRPATPGDIPHIAAVFGRAFEDYRRGLGVTATQLAACWSLSLEARVPQTTVAVLPDGQVAGFIVTVKPGAEENYGGATTFRKRLALMRSSMRWTWLWRAPALFIPMGMAYSKRHAQKDELYVSLVGVDPSFQGQGIGQSLLLAAEAEARACDAAAVLLHTASTNLRARASYQRAGFELVSTVRAPWSGPAHIPAYVALRKPLHPSATPRLDTLPQLSNSDGR